MRLKGETSVLFIARTRTQVTIVRSSENSQEKWDRVLNSRVAYWTFPRQHHRTLGMLRVDRSLSIDLLMKSLRLITEPLSIKKSDTWGHRVNPDRIYILRWSSFSNIYMHVCMFKSRSRLLAKLRIVLLYHRELFPSPLGTWHCFWKKRKKKHSFKWNYRCQVQYSDAKPLLGKSWAFNCNYQLILSFLFLQKCKCAVESSSRHRKRLFTDNSFKNRELYSYGEVGTPRLPPADLHILHRFTFNTKSPRRP